MSGQLNIRPSDDYVTINPDNGALLKYLEKHGRFPRCPYSRWRTSRGRSSSTSS